MESNFRKGKARRFLCLHRNNINKDINESFTELEYFLEEITEAMGKNMGLQLTNMFKTCEDCALGKAKKAGVSKTSAANSTINGERIFIDISSPPTVSTGGKRHWLLVMEDTTNYTQSIEPK